MEIISHSRIREHDLPAYDLPNPGSQNGSGRVCIIYSLFIGNDHEPESDYHKYLINASFWSAHAWRVNSDLIEKRGDIYFHVERRLYDQPAVRLQFEKANLTESVILFDAPKGEATQKKLGLKLYATLHPAFDNYERVYHLDADTFLCRHPSAPPLDMNMIHDIGEDESLLNMMGGQRTPGIRIRRPRYDLPKPEGLARLRYHIENYLGEKLRATMPGSLTKAELEYHIDDEDMPIIQGWSYWGGIIVWNPQQLRQDFKKMVVQLTPNICCDETQFEIYRIKTETENKPLDHIWKEKEITLNGNSYSKFMRPNSPQYFFEHHTVIDPNDPEFDRDAWYQKWYSHIGLYRR